MRAVRGTAVVRLGVLGNMSPTYSTIASKENIATAAVDPMNAKGDPCRFSHPRWAAQLTAAGAVKDRKPATIPMPKATAKM